MGTPDTITELATEFFAALGQAITEWAYVEEELFHICASVLKTRQDHAAIVYYRTPSLDARLTLTNDLASSILPKKEKAGAHTPKISQRWNEIIKDIRNIISVRNQLAHSPTAPIVNASQSGTGSARFDFSYTSYVSATEKLRGRSTKADLSLKDVLVHTKDVSQIINRLRNFRERELPALLR